jgi:hypothetical protein
MRHRHLAGASDSPSAVEDILDRGAIEDWRDLARRVRLDLNGQAAASLRQILKHRHMYGTTHLWIDYLRDLEDDASRASDSRTRGSV